MKTCSKCQIKKELIEFYKDKTKKDGVCSICKFCYKHYRICHKEEIKKQRNQHYLNHKEDIKQRSFQWRVDHPNYIKQYKCIHRKEIQDYENKKKKIDLNYKLRSLLRSRLSSALKNNQKAGSAVKDLGCSIEFLKQYLESRFQKGMSWKNHGKWHIDHITPLANFNLLNKEEFLKACHYTNLQPLWAKDNLKKNRFEVTL